MFAPDVHGVSGFYNMKRGLQPHYRDLLDSVGLFQPMTWEFVHVEHANRLRTELN